MLRQLRFCLLVLILAPLTAAAQDKATDIFILSSHSKVSEWEQLMSPPLQELIRERPDLNIVVSNLPFISYPDVETLEHDRDSVLALFTRPPRLVVLLGGSCFSFAPDIQQRWPGIPMLLLGEQDYYCDLEYTLFGPGDPLAKRYSIINLRNQGANLTLISAPALVRRTVDMILQVQPNLEKLFFVAGENYLSKERQWRLENYMRDRHPEIAYQAILSTNTNTDQLITILQQEGGPRTAVIYGSWIIREGYQQSYSTRHNTVSLIENIAPIYTLFGSSLEKHPYVMGFYSFSQEEYSRNVRQRILDILDHGIQPSEMPFDYMESGVPTLNYQAMQHFGMDASLIPADAVVFHAPLTLWQQHKKQIIIAALLLLILLGGFVFFIMTKTMRSLRKARNMAENANNMKTAFIQNMSHEVRTPLNSIVGFAQLLCLPDDSVSEEEKNEYLSYVMNNSQLLTVMVNDMLGIADMENGQYIIHKAPTNLNEMFRQALKAVEYRVPPGVEIVQVPGIEENARFMTDGMRVQQILINFLTNACKHTTSGKIVFGSSLVENPGYITFYVADSGTGVPADKAEEIFDRFVKLDTHKQGAGLGLSICRMVANSLGGKVWLDTQYTEGARFVLAIPKEEA